MEEKELFDALCFASICHFVDVAYHKKNNRKNLMEKSRGVLEKHYIDFESSSSVYENYNRLLEDYIAKKLPNLRPSHDYYGAKCFVDEKFDRKQGKFCGDSSGHYMYFENSIALDDYINKLNNCTN